MDICGFLERAAIMEFDGGLSRFEAETLAAQAQGFQRHEVMNEIHRRDFEQARNNGETPKRITENAMPGMQPEPTKENGPVLERDVQAGRGGVVLSPLRK